MLKNSCFCCEIRYFVTITLFVLCFVTITLFVLCFVTITLFVLWVFHDNHSTTYNVTYKVARQDIGLKTWAIVGKMTQEDKSATMPGIPDKLTAAPSVYKCLFSSLFTWCWAERWRRRRRSRRRRKRRIGGGGRQGVVWYEFCAHDARAIVPLKS